MKNSVTPNSQLKNTQSLKEKKQEIPICENADQLHVYLVPFRWWKDAQDSSTFRDLKKMILYTASPASLFGGLQKFINNLFCLDLSFNLKKEHESVSENHEFGEVRIWCREYAIISGDMWLQAYKWHSGSKNSMKNRENIRPAEKDISDIFPMHLKLSLLQESNHFAVKISKKENSGKCFKRASKIFNVETETLRLWDFTGQTSQLSEQDVLLELQVYGFSEPLKNKGNRIPNGTCTTMNGHGEDIASSSFKRNSGGAGTIGLTGLQNLGNTCFMNSALQCLAHTPKIVDFFLGDYKKEINSDNPLGKKGEIASAFGDLLKKLWSPRVTSLAPKTFKSKLDQFAPQFSGWNQHDSQEFLVFLLDFLHEDLNRVKHKPYVETFYSVGRSDEETADDYWNNHLARNDSIIIDACNGQYRSTLVCPICGGVSYAFDPFVTLSLSLATTSKRAMTLTVVNPCGPFSPTVHVPTHGNLEDLIQALSTVCSLGIDERLLITEVFNNRVIRFLDDTANSLSLIRDVDRLVVYRVPKDTDGGVMVIFLHKHMEQQSMILYKVRKLFGIPLVAYSKINNGFELRNLYCKLLSSFLTSSEAASMEVSDTISYLGFKFFLVLDEKTEGTEMKMNEPISSTVGSPARLNIVVQWPDDAATEQFKTSLLCSVPEVLNLGFPNKKPQGPVSLYKCVDAFLNEETPLGPNDTWHCPSCNNDCQAAKRLDLWRLPEVLVIHLKRFSYTRYSSNKLETFVDFPIHDFELSTHTAYKNKLLPHRYVLYAIINHYGCIGGGHYTSYIHHVSGQWYEFDDIYVSPINEDKIKTSAAYVLFYKRVNI